MRMERRVEEKHFVKEEKGKGKGKERKEGKEKRN